MRNMWYTKWPAYLKVHEIEPAEGDRYKMRRILPATIFYLHNPRDAIAAFVSSWLGNERKGGLIGDLERDNTVTFHFLEGEVDSDPGPGIAGYYDSPYYSYYKFPRTFFAEDDDESEILEAYDLLYETIALHGPFDGVLGFSHGGTLAAGFLIHHAKVLPHAPPVFRCAIFVNSLPPFRMHPGEYPVIDEGLEGYIKIPCVNVAGAKDPLFKCSLALHQICDPQCSTFVVHGKGHDIPTDRKNVAIMATAIRQLSAKMSGL